MADDGYGSIVLPAKVRKSLNLVRAKISSFKMSDFVNSELYKPSVHMFRRNGKLLRPTLVLLSAHFLGEDPKDYVDLAVAAELMHTSSLIHDDIIDRDSERGRIPTVHKEYGSQSAILAGDALISKAMSIFAKYGHEVIDAIAKSSLDMCAGEILDYEFQKRKKIPDVEQYLNIATLKSASLIASCCNAAAIHRKSKSADRMYRFGKDIGIAFQMRDDIIDYIKWDKDGKKGSLAPNIVSSIQYDYNISKNASLAKAKELNEEYVKRAYRNLGEGPAAKFLKAYADLIIVQV